MSCVICNLCHQLLKTLRKQICTQRTCSTTPPGQPRPPRVSKCCSRTCNASSTWRPCKSTCTSVKNLRAYTFTLSTYSRVQQGSSSQRPYLPSQANITQDFPTRRENTCKDMKQMLSREAVGQQWLCYMQHCQLKFADFLVLEVCSYMVQNPTFWKQQVHLTSITLNLLVTCRLKPSNAA